MTSDIEDQHARDPAGLARYLLAWQTTSLRWIFLGTSIGRLAQTMAPLAMLLVIHEQTSTFAVAGSAVAVYGFAAVLGTPLIARLADSRGAIAFVASAALSCSGYLLIATVGTPLGAYCGAVLAGACTPPLTSTLRASIVQYLPSKAAQNTAFSLDAILAEVLFVVGPAAVGVLVATAQPAVALFCCAALVVAGSSVVSVTNRSRPQPCHSGKARPRTALFLQRCLVWIAVAALQMTAIGLIEVAVTARALALGAASSSGLLLAVWAAGSVCGGLVYGSRAWRMRQTTQLRLLLVCVSAGFALLIPAGELAVMVAAMAVSGLAIAPSATALVATMGAMLGESNRAEGFAWLSSASNLGGAAGYAVAGLIVGHGGVGFALALAAVLPLAGFLLISVVVQRVAFQAELTAG